MTTRQRIVTVLRDAGLPYREIAAALGVSYHTVRCLEQRARAHQASAA